MTEKINGMLKLQTINNDLTFPTWRSANLGWHDAIMVEAVEAFDSVPWKWWKKSEADIPNLQIELVDIWHFIMSLAMVRYGDAIALDKLNKFEDEYFKYKFDASAVKICLKTIIGECSKLDEHLIDIEHLMDNFLNAVYVSFESFDDFVKLYIAKNALNGFRQSRGYKDGTYVKMWTIEDENDTVPKEDNHFVHLFITSEPMYDVDVYMADLIGFLSHIYDTYVVPVTDKREVNSSNLAFIELIGNDCTVTFKNGTAYKYANTTREEFEALAGAESVGAHFNSVFKPTHPDVVKV